MCTIEIGNLKKDKAQVASCKCQFCLIRVMFSHGIKLEVTIKSGDVNRYKIVVKCMLKAPLHLKGPIRKLFYCLIQRVFFGNGIVRVLF